MLKVTLGDSECHIRMEWRRFSHPVGGWPSAGSADAIEAGLKALGIWRARLEITGMHTVKLFLPKTSLHKAQDYIFACIPETWCVQVVELERPLALKKHTYVIKYR